jgi:hypothetical protein
MKLLLANSHYRPEAAVSSINLKAQGQVAYTSPRAVAIEVAGTTICVLRFTIWLTL